MTTASPNSGFVRVCGTHFTLHDRPVYFTGTNSYYQMGYRRWQAPGPDEVLDKAAARGINLVRTWAFQDQVEAGAGLQCAPARQLTGNERPVDYLDPDTLAALDHTLAAADARGIRLILTLVNNWADYGGMDRWTLWRFGAVDHDRFYADPIIRGWYKDLCNALVSRVNSVNGRLYRDEPAIFAWELTNEGRAASGAAASVDAWIAEMSGYLKSIDPNHLVTTGMEGFYGPAFSPRNTDSWMTWCGHDFINNHRHASIDFATCHIWPQNWGWSPTTSPQAALDRATRFLRQRLDDAAVTLNKPLVCGEFGVPRDNQGRGLGSGPTTIRDLFLETLQGICEQDAASGGACAGMLNWMVLHDGYSQYDDGNGIFLPADASTDAILTAHAGRMLRMRRGEPTLDSGVDQSDAGIMRARPSDPGGFS